LFLHGALARQAPTVLFICSYNDFWLSARGASPFQKHTNMTHARKEERAQVERLFFPPEKQKIPVKH
jgi:hypothetical protein